MQQVLTEQGSAGLLWGPAEFAPVWHYEVFGGVLAANLHIPELPVVERGEADWSLFATDADPERRTTWVVLGQDVVQEGVNVRLLSHAGRFRLLFDDTGCFDISPCGRRILWYGRVDLFSEEARTDLLGRVLATALHASGKLCLHGSAVQIRDGAVAFLAPKLHGKSTTALALTRAGAKLLTDDTLAVVPDEPVRALPGVHAVRLWEDAAGRVVPERLPETGAGGKKLCINDLPDDCLAHSASPLSAVYLLAPSIASSGAPIRRTRVSPLLAALLLVRHSKLAALLGKSQASVVLERAVAVSRAVPVYSLAVQRGFGHLDAIADQLLAWHGASRTVAMSAALAP